MKGAVFLTSLPLIFSAAASLLASEALVSGSGEYCHGWRDARAGWRDGFQCPERTDRSGAVICCGRCHLRYCCATGAARLDQGTCENHDTVRESNASPGDAAEVPVHVPFLIVGSVFVLFVCLGAGLAVCLFLSRQTISHQPTQNRAESITRGHAPDAVPVMVSTGASFGSSSSSLWPVGVNPPSMPPNPSHTAVEPAPPSCQACFTPPPDSNPLPCVMTIPMVFHHSRCVGTMMHPYMVPAPSSTLHGGQVECIFTPTSSPCPPPTISGTTHRTLQAIL